MRSRMRLVLVVLAILVLLTSGCFGDVIGWGKHTLIMQFDGFGYINPPPGSHSVKKGPLKLEAKAGSGWRFSHWTGEVASKYDSETEIWIDQDQTVTAFFIPEGRESQNLSLMMQSGQVYSIGQSSTELPEPNRIEQSMFGLTWYVYNEDYTNFVMLAVDGGKICGFYTNSRGFALSNGVSWGDSETKSYEQVPDTILEVYYDQHADNTVHAVIAATEKGDANASAAGYLNVQSLQQFDCINAFRVNYGKSPLLWDEAAAKAARLHSQDMADSDYFSHTSQDGRVPYDRYRAVNERHLTAWGENIAAGRIYGIDSFNMLANSLGHRNNMLNSRYRYLGVGTAYNPNSTYHYYTTELYVSF